MDATQWSSEEVASQLRTVGLNKYRSEFLSRNIDGRSLFSLKENDLRDMGMPVVHRMTFTNWVGSLPHSPPSRAPPKKANQTASNISSQKTTSTTSKLSTRSGTSSTSTSKSINQKTTTSIGQRSNFSKDVSSGPRGSHVRSTASTNHERPRGTSTVHTFAPPSDDFNINELNFAPPPHVSSIPKTRKLGKGGPRAPPVPEDGSTDGRVECRFCGRKFASDRISVHERACAHGSHKRRVFDSQKQRLDGNPEAIAMAKRSLRSKNEKPKMIGGKPKYKIEHENLVAALRAARNMSKYESDKARGKATGPPPPMPVMQDLPDDRIECPYCGRKFGHEQFERHEKFCSTRVPLRATTNRTSNRTSTKKTTTTTKRRPY